MNQPNIIFLYGATASGKTKLAVEIAKKSNAEIINCDSKQVYKEIPIITAQPMRAEKQGIKHHLYGSISAKDSFSVMDWISQVVPIIHQISKAGKTPLIVGGTGMYIKYLIEGMPDIPNISAETKLYVRDMIEQKGVNYVHNILSDDIKIKLNANDKQRVSRAHEVFIETGKSLRYWQKRPNKKFISGFNITKIYLSPDRKKLYKNSDSRFDEMIVNGVLNEIEALMKLNIDSQNPSMLSHGVPELIKYIKGEFSFQQASDKAKQNTRNYIKRQSTWFNNQFDADYRFEN